MGEHKCKVAFNCGEHAVYEEIAVTCPYCRIAELEQRNDELQRQVNSLCHKPDMGQLIGSALNTGGDEG
jgi:hypothetical protein